MRLNQYLNEEIEIDEALDMIQDQCDPFIKLMRKTDVIYRGVNNSGAKAYEPIKKFMHSEGRIPLSTPKAIHNELNNIFTEKFGWPVRDGIFCSFGMGNITIYGLPHYIFGIGKVQYCYSTEIDDLWADIGTYTRRTVIGQSNGNKDKYLNFKLTDYVLAPNMKVTGIDKEYLESIVDKYYQDNGLKRFRGEISFNFPDGYYVMRCNGPYDKNILNMIKGG